MNNKCAFIKSNKEHCGSYPLMDSKYCFWHDPIMLVERKIARRRGGINRRKTQRNVNSSSSINNVQDLIKIVETTIEDVVNLDEARTRGRTLCYLYTTLIKINKHSDKERVNQLKWRLKELKWRVKASERYCYLKLYLANYLNDTGHILDI